VFVVAVLTMVFGMVLILVEMYSIFSRSYPVDTGAVPFFGSKVKIKVDESEEVSLKLPEAGAALRPRKRGGGV
jgi:hypothetical protein